MKLAKRTGDNTKAVIGSRNTSIRTGFDTLRKVGFDFCAGNTPAVYVVSNVAGTEWCLADRLSADPRVCVDRAGKPAFEIESARHSHKLKEEHEIAPALWLAGRLEINDAPKTNGSSTCKFGALRWTVGQAQVGTYLSSNTAAS